MLKQFKTRYVSKHEKKLHKRELDAISHPDNNKFKSIYIICSISIMLSIILPEIRSSGRLRFIWENGYFDIYDLLMISIPIVLCIGIILVATYVSSRNRAKLFFLIFSIIFIGVFGFFGIAAFFFSQDIDFILGLVFSLLITVGPIGYYTSTVLLTKYNHRRIMKSVVYSAIMILIVLFVPLINNDIFIEEILDEVGVFFPMISIVLLFSSMLIIFSLVFSREPKQYAKVNSIILKISILLFPISIMLSENSLSWREFSEIFRASLAIFGVYFLICYSAIEYFTNRLSVQIVPFATPILGIIDKDNIFAGRTHTNEPTDDSEPYKSMEK